MAAPLITLVALASAQATSATADDAAVYPPFRYPLSDVVFSYRGVDSNGVIEVHGDGHVWRYNFSQLCPAPGIPRRAASAQEVVGLLRLCYQGRFFELPSEYLPFTRDVRLHENGTVEEVRAFTMSPETRTEHLTVCIGSYCKSMVFVEDGRPPSVVRELARRMREMGKREPRPGKWKEPMRLEGKR